MHGFRVRAVRRALATSLFVPLVAGAILWAQHSGVELAAHRWVACLSLALSAIPTTMHLLTAAAGQPWDKLERDWNGLQLWQRWASSLVALICGLTAGAAVVVIIFALAELDAEATQPVRNPPQSFKSSE